MTQQESTTRAVVPYRPPCEGVGAVCRAFFCRFSEKADNLFRARKRQYLCAMLLLSVGLLLGSYFSAFRTVHIEALAFLRCTGVTISLTFFFGMTVFGIVCVPLLWFVLAFLFGCVASGLSLSSAQGILGFGCLLLFYMLVLLFFTEAFRASARISAGWKVLFCKKSFLYFVLLFFFTLLCRYVFSFLLANWLTF